MTLIDSPMASVIATIASATPVIISRPPWTILDTDPNAKPNDAKAIPAVTIMAMKPISNPTANLMTFIRRWKPGIHFSIHPIIDLTQPMRVDITPIIQFRTLRNGRSASAISWKKYPTRALIVDLS